MGSFHKKSVRSLILSPVEASISASALDVAFLEDLGDIDIEVYSGSGAVVYSESVNTQTQEQFSINVSEWDSGNYQIRFINSGGNYMYGVFEIGSSSIF